MPTTTRSRAAASTASASVSARGRSESLSLSTKKRQRSRSRSQTPLLSQTRSRTRSRSRTNSRSRSVRSDSNSVASQTLQKGSGLTLNDFIVIEDRFIMDREVGRGSFGAVWRAVNKEDGKVYALKLIEIADRETQREIDILSSFSRDICHPNIVCYYGQFRGSFQGKDYHVIEMEFIDGYSLKTFFAQWFTGRPSDKQPPKKIVCRLLLQAFDALKTLHGRGILHLDVKPANIMIRHSNGELVLIDFGFSCNVDAPLDNARTGCAASFLSGSPLYISPDRVLHCQESKTCDIFTLRANDVYALALSFFYSLNTGAQNAFNDTAESLVRVAKATDSNAGSQIGGASNVSSTSASSDTSIFLLMYADILREWEFKPTTVYARDEEIDALLRKALVSHDDERPTAKEIFDEAIVICAKTE